MQSLAHAEEHKEGRKIIRKPAKTANRMRNVEGVQNPNPEERTIRLGRF